MGNPVGKIKGGSYLIVRESQFEGHIVDVDVAAKVITEEEQKELKNMIVYRYASVRILERQRQG